MTADTDKPTKWHDDLPTVQIPLGADRPGLSIDGEFMSVFELPDDAREAYTKYAQQGGNIRIWQCDTCGYLTNADALSATSRRSYQCGGCGGQTASRGLQRSASTSFTRVHGPRLGPDDERFVDIEALDAEASCEHPVTGDADECDLCVPNHPSHLGKLKNKVSGEINQREMLHEVARAVKEFREA